MAVPWAGPGPIARANVSVPPGAVASTPAGLGHEAGKEGEVRKVTEQSGKIGLSQVRGGQRERCREEPGEGRFRRAQLLQAALARGRNRRTRLGGHQRASQEQCPPQWQPFLACPRASCGRNVPQQHQCSSLGACPKCCPSGASFLQEAF